MSDNNSSGGGFGLCTVLFIVFLVLKLTEVIDWSWWYVTMPLWIGWAIFGGIAFVFGIGALFIALMVGRK